MTGWLLSIVGVVFLGVLLDIIYPNGKTNAFCKSIFAIISIMVMIKPLVNFNFDNINANTFVDENIVDSLNNAKLNNMKLRIDSALEMQGIYGAFVEIYGNFDNNDCQIENVYIDVSNVVLSENLKNINKYEVIHNVITDTFDIDAEKVIVYG